MGKKTPLYEYHLASEAKIVDFAGWDMPIHYGSQLAEHEIVRSSAGMFDVSHMAVIDIEGLGSTAYLQLVLTSDVGCLVSGKALYSCMLNDAGGIIDDLIIYKINENFYRLVVNAAPSDKDWAWLNEHVNNFVVTLKRREDLAIIATQGPSAAEKIISIFKDQHENIKSLKPFHILSIDDKWVARTGYTGEDGFEWMIPQQQAASFWQSLLAHGFSPCGLGARDTLRLEAGLNLYGADMDENVTPLESNLGWTIAWKPQARNFIGREALEKQLKEGVKRSLVGLLLEDQGIPRNHQKVIIEDNGIGEITSGSFSPTLKKGIALARVPVGQFDRCWVDIRGKKVLARVVKTPFVKYGRKMV